MDSKLSIAGRLNSGSLRNPSLLGLSAGALLLILPLFVVGQERGHDHREHMGGHPHEVHGDMMNGWPMPPMAPGMEMMPGMDGLIPSVLPFLPSADGDLSSVPFAEPSRVVDLADGDTLTLSASFVRREINGNQYLMYGYNGQYPGPLIRVPLDATPVIRLVNEIDLPTTVHWHGIRVENRFDGVPDLTQPPIEPGDTFSYHVHVPDAGIFWYHPHLREDIQQGLGLYGNVFVIPRDTEDDYAPVNHEEFLVLDDLLVGSNGNLIPFGAEHSTHALMGRFGNVLLTNGTTDHRTVTEAGSVVRFFITNVASARTFNLQFDGKPVKLVASDIGRYEREEWVENVIIAPAERYVVEVRFDEPGPVAITNTVQAIDKWQGDFFLQVDTVATVEVRSERVVEDFGDRFSDLGRSPSVISEIEAFRDHFAREPDKHLTLTLRTDELPVPIVAMMEIDTLYVPPVEWNDPMPMMNWISTGNEVTWILREDDTGKENEEIRWDFSVGDVVKIRVFNDPRSFHPMNHPIHIHGQRFLVVERDGVAQTNLVWKDTAHLPVGSTMDLLLEVSNPGDWMMHCHIPEHLESGMMFTLSVRE